MIYIKSKKPINKDVTRYVYIKRIQFVLFSYQKFPMNQKLFNQLIWLGNPKPQYSCNLSPGYENYSVYDAIQSHPDIANINWLPASRKKKRIKQF